MTTIFNTAGIEVTAYSTWDEAVQALVIEPLGEYADEFDVDAIAEEVIEAVDRYVTRGGKRFQTFHGYAYGLADDADNNYVDFWAIVEKHALSLS